MAVIPMPMKFLDQNWYELTPNALLSWYQHFLRMFFVVFLQIFCVKKNWPIFFQLFWILDEKNPIFHQDQHHEFVCHEANFDGTEKIKISAESQETGHLNGKVIFWTQRTKNGSWLKNGYWPRRPWWPSEQRYGLDQKTKCS